MDYCNVFSDQRYSINALYASINFMLRTNLLGLKQDEMGVPDPYLYKVCCEDIDFFYKLVTLQDNDDIEFLKNANFKIFPNIKSNNKFKGFDSKTLIHLGYNILDIIRISRLLDIMFTETRPRVMLTTYSFFRNFIICIIKNTIIPKFPAKYMIGNLSLNEKTNEMREKLITIISNLTTENWSRIASILQPKINLDKELKDKLHELIIPLDFNKEVRNYFNTEFYNYYQEKMLDRFSDSALDELLPQDEFDILNHFIKSIRNIDSIKVPEKIIEKDEPSIPELTYNILFEFNRLKISNKEFYKKIYGLPSHSSPINILNFLYIIRKMDEELETDINKIIGPDLILFFDILDDKDNNRLPKLKTSIKKDVNIAVIFLSVLRKINVNIENLYENINIDQLKIYTNIYDKYVTIPIKESIILPSVIEEPNKLSSVIEESIISPSETEESIILSSETEEPNKVSSETEESIILPSILPNTTEKINKLIETYKKINNRILIQEEIIKSYQESVEINKTLCNDYCKKRKNEIFRTVKSCRQNNCLDAISFLKAIRFFIQNSETKISYINTSFDVNKFLNCVLCRTALIFFQNNDIDDFKFWFKNLSSRESIDVYLSFSKLPVYLSKFNKEDYVKIIKYIKGYKGGTKKNI